MVKHLESKEEFDNAIKSRVLVDFYADWCGPCKRLGPVLETIDYVDVLKVNVDSFPEIAREYGVMSIPTLIFFKDGQQLRKEIGFKTADEIHDMIK